MRVLFLRVGPNENPGVPVVILVVDAFASSITMLLSYGMARIVLPIIPVPCGLGPFALEFVVLSLVPSLSLEALLSLAFIEGLASAALMAW